MSDAGYQFHYFRLTADDRILWGGYDAVYHPGNARRARSTTARPATFDALGAQLPRDVPAARRRRASPTAGAARSTPRRGSASRSATRSAGASTTRWATRAWAWGRAAGRRGSCATGCWTRLGRCSGCGSCGRAPFPIPPEPARTPAVELMRRAVDRADANEGRRGLFLQAMDALGIGFDS